MATLRAHTVFEESAVDGMAVPTPDDLRNRFGAPPRDVSRDDASHESRAEPDIDIALASLSEARRLSIYAPMAVYDIVEELRHLSRRAIEPNIFFDPRFLAPAMPRLDDRRVRLMVIRDEASDRSRLRLLMPFTVERSLFLGRSAIVRAWSHPFGPLGTLPIDGDDPAEIATSFLKALTRPELGLPDILVLPNLPVDGPVAKCLEQAAETERLPVRIIQRHSRAALRKDEFEHPLIAAPLSRKRLRELCRQRRRLEEIGPLSLETATTPETVRLALEDFLILEAAGWKGRQRSALISDRYRSAFAREAINDLAAGGNARIFTLRVGSEPAASLIVLADRGEAYAWKMAYSEAFASASPGQQIVAEATRALAADPSIRQADSCTVPDHFVMNRFWHQRRTLGTFVIGLAPHLERRVERAASGIVMEHRARNSLRIARRRLMSLVGTQ